MANTKIPVELSSTPGIVDNSNATAITIDSSENVGIGGTPDTQLNIKNADDAVVRIESIGSEAGDDARLEIKTTNGTFTIQNDRSLGTTGALTFAGNTSDNIVIDHATGNVGIGTSSPSEALSVSGNMEIIRTAPHLDFMEDGVTDLNHRIRQNAGNLYFQLLSDDKGTSTDNLILDSNGQLLVNPLGVSTPSIAFTNDNNTGITRPTTDTLQFVTGGSEAMRINSSGLLLVSTTTSSGLSNGTTNYGHSFGGGQQVNATNNDTNLILNMSNGSSNPHIQFRSDGGNTGNISTNGSAVSYNTGSDYRLKENVIPIKDGLNRLTKLNPVQFDWKESQETDEGFIAHEVQEIVPHVVKGEKDGEEIQTMDYGKLTPLLVKAIQEQQAQIEALQSEINLLKGE